jgi:hypothetical protein
MIYYKTLFVHLLVISVFVFLLYGIYDDGGLKHSY